MRSNEIKFGVVRDSSQTLLPFDISTEIASQVLGSSDLPFCPQDCSWHVGPPSLDTREAPLPI